MVKQIIVYFFIFVVTIVQCKADKKKPITVLLTNGEVLRGYLVLMNDTSLVIRKKKSKDFTEIQVSYRKINKIIFKRDYLENTLIATVLIGTTIGVAGGLFTGDAGSFSTTDKMILFGLIGGGLGTAGGFVIGGLREIFKTEKIQINSNLESFLKSKELLEKNIFKLDANKIIIIQ